MPTPVIAVAGDTLCGIAAQHGFTTCRQIRAEAANAHLLDRPLRPGDIVTVPDRVLNRLQRAAEAVHNFVRRGIPAPAIRLIHGSRDRRHADDDSLTFLNVSNYIANKAGTTGQSAFPTGFGFNAHGHADPDTFKIEVIDPGASGNIMVELEALKPVYDATGAVIRHETFTDAQANLRKITVQCRHVGGSSKRFRSRYLKLVTDEEDLAALSGNPPRANGSAQALFTSDMADGTDGDADKVEILDQMVRATYTIARCTAAAPDKCKVEVQLPLAPERQRIRVCFHLFRTTPGVPATPPTGTTAGIGGVTPDNLRRRTWKWYRRTYAQAGLSPVLVGPKIEWVDPPSADMLVISNDTGNPASGIDGTGSQSTLAFDIEFAPGAGPTPTPPPTHVAINLTPGHTPAEVAAAIIAALPAGFAGDPFQNAPALTAVDGSVDLIIRRTDGVRIVLTNESITDSSLTLAVARTNLNSVDQNHPDASAIPASIDFRRVLRCGTSSDDRMDCFVIGQFLGPGLRGRAFVPAIDLPASHQPPAPLRWATVMAATSSSGAVMDGSNNLPFTYPHESGHVLIDAFHTNGTGADQELMSGSGTSETNSITATKRICDDPVRVQYAVFTPQPAPTVGDARWTNISAVPRLIARGTQVFAAW